MNEPAPAEPDPLDLYRLAVQHPLAEVGFIEHVWSQVHGEGEAALLLREDFAGTCAVAAAWVASDPDRQAMAVERDERTAAWAADRFDDADLHIVTDDVVAVDGPAVDVAVALNFSVLIYHDRPALLGYLRNALGGLNPGGLLIMDLFGGSGLDRPVTVTRKVEPDEAGFEPFSYVWDQGGVDPQSGRVCCRIHFELGDGRRLDDAFIYDWRLWSSGELIEAAEQAGFSRASVWWSAPGGAERFQPLDREPDAEDWVAYIVCVAP